MNSTRPVLLSAVQPTNPLTLGNYLGALCHWPRFQQRYECFFLAVDLHAITVPQDPKKLAAQTLETLATYLAAGIDPALSKLFIQSHVPEHAELTWVLNCHSHLGELARMTQFKSKNQDKKDALPTGLLTYPILMAADILLYQTQLVPVGEDQKQHLEITRDLANRMNKTYQTTLFTIPEMHRPTVGAKIMSLQNPTSKMSKSDPNPYATIFLNDSNDLILKKIKKAVTDSQSQLDHHALPPGVKNLLEIQAALTQTPLQTLLESHRGKQYGALKTQTADQIIYALEPIRKKTEAWLSDLPALKKVLMLGAEQAREKAQHTLRTVYETLGFIGKAF